MNPNTYDWYQCDEEDYNSYDSPEEQLESWLAAREFPPEAIEIVCACLALDSKPWGKALSWGRLAPSIQLLPPEMDAGQNWLEHRGYIETSADGGDYDLGTITLTEKLREELK